MLCKAISAQRSVCVEFLGAVIFDPVIALLLLDKLLASRKPAAHPVPIKLAELIKEGFDESAEANVGKTTKDVNSETIAVPVDNQMEVTRIQTTEKKVDVPHARIAEKTSVEDEVVPVGPDLKFKAVCTNERVQKNKFHNKEASRGEDAAKYSANNSGPVRRRSKKS